MYRICKSLPPLCQICRALLPVARETEALAISECPNCHQKHAAFLPDWLTPDVDLSFFFSAAVQALIELFDYPLDDACSLIREYYQKFTDDVFCRSIGVPVQNADFFWHEAPEGIALRAHYYLRLHGDPDPHKFIYWRTEFNPSTKLG